MTIKQEVSQKLFSHILFISIEYTWFKSEAKNCLSGKFNLLSFALFFCLILINHLCQYVFIFQSVINACTILSDRMAPVRAKLKDPTWLKVGLNCVYTSMFCVVTHTCCFCGSASTPMNISLREFL